MSEFSVKSAIFGRPGPELGAAASTALARIGSEMAELLMKSAIVKSGPMPTRELPHYWMPEQVRQILATMPAGQPWLFARLTG